MRARVVLASSPSKKKIAQRATGFNGSQSFYAIFLVVRLFHYRGIEAVLWFTVRESETNGTFRVRLVQKFWVLGK
jgi:hypothetical protein